jgi:hypothetical protein
MRADHRAELVITKDFGRLCGGEVGLSIDDGKVIMAHLQNLDLTCVTAVRAAGLQIA